MAIEMSCRHGITPSTTIPETVAKHRKKHNRVCFAVDAGSYYMAANCPAYQEPMLWLEDNAGNDYFVDEGLIDSTRTTKARLHFTVYIKDPEIALMFKMKWG